MGLKMTLPKDKNHMATEFVDAYWAITQLSYDIVGVHFKLACFPSRDAKLLDGVAVEDPSIGGFGLCQPIYHPELYSWEPFFRIEDVFPEGIPLGKDAQFTIIYTFIKTYTGLPFEDVLEGDQTEEVETDETEEEPTEELTEDSAAEEPSEEEVPGDEADEIEESDEDTDEDVTEESASEEEGEKENG